MEFTFKATPPDNHQRGRKRGDLSAEIDRSIAAAQAIIDNLQILKDRVDALEMEVGTKAIACPFDATPSERVIWSMLTRHGLVTRSMLCLALWGGLPDADLPKDPNNVVHQFVIRMRKKLASTEYRLISKYGSKFDHAQYYIQKVTKDAA